MRRAKALVAVVLAALWLPVTMHCALEAFPEFSFLACCAHEDAVPHEDEDCKTDACAVVESGFYKLQDHEDLVAASGDVEAIDPCEVEVDAPSGLPRALRPALLAVGWQFSSRAAPLPRAPASLS